MNQASKSKFGPMIIIGALFFVFGFVTWVNSLLIPYFKLTCELTVKEAMLVAFAFYISYFVMALPSSMILKMTGYKKGMMLGLFVMALGAFIFVPAAHTRNYGIFLLGLFVEATGLTLLQTAANPYVTILGPIESAASRISIMGVCNKVAGALAPLLLARALVKDPNEIDEIKGRMASMTVDQQHQVLNELSSRLVWPYIIIGCVLILLGLVIVLSRLPEIQDNTRTGTSHEETKGIWSHPHLLLGVLGIFCGVGVEVIAVDSIINYAQYTGLSFREAKFFATYTLLLMIVSYIIGIFTIPKIISQRKALVFSTIIGIVFSLLALTLKGAASVWCLSLLGLGNALLWPSIWPLSLNGLGKDTSKGSALLIMGVVGGGLIPLVYGALSDAANAHAGYWVLIPLYLYLFYFGVHGYQVGKKKIKLAMTS